MSSVTLQVWSGQIFGNELATIAHQAKQLVSNPELFLPVDGSI